MTYKGKKSHPTLCGGFISIWFSSFLFFFFLTRIWVLYYHEGDEFYQSKINQDVDTNYVQLTRKILDMQLSFVGSGNATDFDQNPYYSLKL